MTTITFTQFIFISGLFGLVEMMIIGALVECWKRFRANQRRKRIAKLKYA